MTSNAAESCWLFLWNIVDNPYPCYISLFKITCSYNYIFKETNHHAFMRPEVILSKNNMLSKCSWYKTTTPCAVEKWYTELYDDTADRWTYKGRVKDVKCVGKILQYLKMVTNQLKKIPKLKVVVCCFASLKECQYYIFICLVYIVCIIRNTSINLSIHI